MQAMFASNSVSVAKGDAPSFRRRSAEKENIENKSQGSTGGHKNTFNVLLTEKLNNLQNPRIMNSLSLQSQRLSARTAISSGSNENQARKDTKADSTSSANLTTMEYSSAASQVNHRPRILGKDANSDLTMITTKARRFNKMMRSQVLDSDQQN